MSCPIAIGDKNRWAGRRDRAMMPVQCRIHPHTNIRDLRTAYPQIRPVEMKTSSGFYQNLINSVLH